jgi:hypothetical protein
MARMLFTRRAAGSLFQEEGFLTQEEEMAPGILRYEPDESPGSNCVRSRHLIIALGSGPLFHVCHVVVGKRDSKRVN